MTPALSLEQQYLGYTIRVIGDAQPEGLAASARVTSGEDQIVCHFVEFLDGFTQATSGWPKEDAEALKQVADRAVHRARGAILLGRIAELNGARLLVPPEHRFAERSEEYLRAVVLSAFKRVFRDTPWQGGRVAFDDIGVGLMEDVDPGDVEYTLARLQGDGLIKSFATGHEAGARLYMPTAAGLTEADRLPVPSRAPGLLLEETVAKVEATLAKYKPELVESLRRQSVRIAESRELGEHQVGEVAQACEQVIWDFLDLDVLWQGITGDRPPRDKTRDRVRLILRARVPSDTEADLTEALDQYLVGWFGPLEQFVHKHRHLPGESERRHAKRCVVYTYLFLSDLLEAIGL